jgi:hypothetical protein
MRSRCCGSQPWKIFNERWADGSSYYTQVLKVVILDLTALLLIVQVPLDQQTELSAIPTTYWCSISQKPAFNDGN